ncbi:hypothetical protein SAMN05660359_00136 [Geodermatophilus obscurus]|uniref:Uncharacterized protein n=1 Tax=Geodermatophilus obscurus TaxID=1861 RepID=A0A1I5C7J7_9ACTN|nr:hypothetical protein [Geodermatophilus obscurus]SFN82846.1 hypothetical protein SAMN05660359_00136 [Geodermatophilus obscurus]
MLWAAVSVLGFVVLTALVVVMARGNTARWERDHRAPQAAARAHGAAVRSGWKRTLSRWQQAEESQDRPARVPALHLPAGLAARLPHPHLPHPHLPLHLPRVHLPRRARSVPQDDAGEDPRP